MPDAGSNPSEAGCIPKSLATEPLPEGPTQDLVTMPTKEMQDLAKRYATMVSRSTDKFVHSFNRASHQSGRNVLNHYVADGYWLPINLVSAPTQATRADLDGAWRDGLPRIHKLLFSLTQRLPDGWTDKMKKDFSSKVYVASMAAW